MRLLVIPYPAIDTVAFHIGPLSISWYALAYSGGLICMWVCALVLVKRDAYWNGAARPKPAGVDYLILYIFAGTAVGGRLGEALIKPAIYLTHPVAILEVWNGGGLFFGAMVGACIAVWIFARRNKCSLLTALDICSPGGRHRRLLGPDCELHSAGTLGASDQRAVGNSISRSRFVAAASESNL